MQGWFLYTGITNKLEKRIAEHNEGKDIFLLLIKKNSYPKIF
jgi:predicted GIY-YIG superfamily endonuclease